MPSAELPSVLEHGGTGPSDLVLVQRALRGEEAATDQLIQRLSCIPRFVFRLNCSGGPTLPTHALEDVVQQVYLAVWPRLCDFAGSAALESWVYGFCRNCLRAEARRRRYRGMVKAVEDEELARRADDAAPPPELPPDRLTRMERLDHLRDELDRLAKPERAVVEMRHLDGISFEDIARRLGLPPSTVKDRCYRALLKIKERLVRRDLHL